VLLLAVTGGLVPARAAGGTVNVFYAGSLTNVNENLVGPAFAAATGYTYQGKSAGSLAIANQIKGRIATPDVVEFADPTVNATLMGSANGNYVSWFFTYARSELVIGFDPRSKYAKAFQQVQKHQLPWYRALLQHGLRLGRTDPNLDPKGYRALFMAGLAQHLYHLKNFKRTVFGADLNTAQIFPEEVLVARMLTGQIDAGVFYLSEVRDLGIPYISLPAQVNLGASNLSKLYATQQFTTDKGVKITGAPILYTITIPSTVKDVDGAQAFIRFVLGKRVRSVSARHGLLPLPIKATGDRSMVPAGLAGLIGK
jgi:molybdate/tungstate transport system substrate-binding protein